LYASLSEADLAFCSQVAFYTGPDPGRIDRIFRGSGRMRQKWDRTDYRDRTITKALEGRTEFYTPGPRVYIGSTGTNGVHVDDDDEEPPDPPNQDGGEPTPTLLTNYYECEVEVEDADGKKKKETTKLGKSAATVAGELTRVTGGWPKRVEQNLFVPDQDRPLYLDDPAALFAWAGRQLPAGDRNAIRWVGQGPDKLSRAEFLAHLQQTVEQFNAVEAYPHWPQMPGHYYLHPKLQGGDGKALAGLLKRFRPATPFDASLIESFLLTLVAGVPAGARPAFLFTAPGGDGNGGRGVGKTTVAEMGALLVGGTVDISAKDDMADIKKRLFSPTARHKRAILLDNVKTLRFSWDELEAFVTATTVSGYQLYEGEGRAPNTFTVCITLNGATLSKDMAARCVVITLKRPDYDPKWREETIAYIEANRWAVLGDLVGKLKQPAAPLAWCSRWGSWESVVLSRLPQADDLQTLIAQRQEAVDDDQDEADLVREAFRADLQARKHDPDREAILLPTRDCWDILRRRMDDSRAVTKVTPYLKTLNIRELRQSNRGDAKGWVWTGSQAGSQAAVTLNERSVFDVPGR
jgi:hypothetical protein